MLSSTVLLWKSALKGFTFQKNVYTMCTTLCTGIHIVLSPYTVCDRMESNRIMDRTSKKNINKIIT